MKNLLLLGLILMSGVLLTACGNKTDENSGDNTACALWDSECEVVADSESNVDEIEEKRHKRIDYLVLVNKENKLPEDWEDNLELMETRNVYDEEIQIDRRTFKQFRKLKKSLNEEWIDIELDSVYRWVEKQQQIWDDFEKEYGEDYVKKYVAVPWYSEHHTSLAVDIALIKDGKIIWENDAMLAETEIFAKIHEKLADYGFILRYPKWKEDITWYSYEPWHFRYVGNEHVSREIYENGWTLEEYLENRGK